MLDRREFLTIAAATAIPVSRRDRCLLATDSDLSAECLRGYQACLQWDIRQSVAGKSELIIVPGFRTLAPEHLKALRSEALDGASVLLESGLAFASKDEIRTQQAQLHDYFDITIASELASAKPVEFRYVRYRWPVEALVRDFSEWVTIDPRMGEAIAHIAGQVAGVRQTLGRGTVVYLGSPLGPALLAGDTQAAEWIHSLVQYTSWR